MAYLKIKHIFYEKNEETGENEKKEEILEFPAISEYNISNIQNVNRFTGEKGNTIIYPVRMHKKRISVTAEMISSDYNKLLDFIKYAEFECVYMDGEYEETGFFSLTSDISLNQIYGRYSFMDYSQPEPVQVGFPALFAVSFTIEEV